MLSAILTDAYEYPVKGAKYKAFGKKCNPSRGSNKHRKGPFQPKRGCLSDLCVCLCVCVCVGGGGGLLLNLCVNSNMFDRPIEFQALSLSTLSVLFLLLLLLLLLLLFSSSLDCICTGTKNQGFRYDFY